MNYEDVTELLRGAYETSAAQRDKTPKDPWKLHEREEFLARLNTEGKTRLLEVGAGTGHDSLFFQDAGLDVVATDLTPAMVELCRAKGLDARAADFMNLSFRTGSFDAVWALNCLLHVPNASLPRVLLSIRDVLVEGGLFFLGLYGGEQFEGIKEDDWHEPPRFFCFRTDEEVTSAVSEVFEIVEFHVNAPAADDTRNHFQSLTLRKVS